MNAPPSSEPDVPSAAAPSAKGQSSRALILRAAAQLATIKGLTGLSIGDLAAAVGMSKSGLYAHFKSKEELELATIETAADIFDHEVLRTALAAPAGSQRLRALVDSFLAHLERRVFPGGCFFAAVATELDTRPGPARDRVLDVQEKWHALLTRCFQDAQALGEIDSGADIAQAAFETEAMLVAANFRYVMTNDPTPLARARRGTAELLARLAVRPPPTSKRAARRRT